MPWGTKNKSMETKLPKVSANLCCAILIHNCIQKLETPLAIVPATTFAVDLKPDQVRWSVSVLRSL